MPVQPREALPDLRGSTTTDTNALRALPVLASDLWNLEPLLCLGLPTSERVLFFEVQSLPALVWMNHFWRRALENKPPTREEVDLAYQECEGFTLASVWEKISKVRAGELPDLQYRHDLVDTEVGMLFEVAQWAWAVQSMHYQAFYHLAFDDPFLVLHNRVARQYFNPITGGVRPYYTRDDFVCSRVHEFERRSGVSLARLRYQSAISRYAAHNMTAAAHMVECIGRYHLDTKVCWQQTDDTAWRDAMRGQQRSAPTTPVRVLEANQEVANQRRRAANAIIETLLVPTANGPLQPSPASTTRSERASDEQPEPSVTPSPAKTTANTANDGQLTEDVAGRGEASNDSPAHPHAAITPPPRTEDVDAPPTIAASHDDEKLDDESISPQGEQELMICEQLPAADQENEENIPPTSDVMDFEWSQEQPMDVQGDDEMESQDALPSEQS